MLTASTSSYAEVFRQIRAILQFATANRSSNVLMVASPGPRERKTTIICNVAVAFAHTGRCVVIIDGALRRPSTRRFFEAGEREPGFSNLLADLSTELTDVGTPNSSTSFVYSAPGQTQRLLGVYPGYQGPAPLVTTRRTWMSPVQCPEFSLWLATLLPFSIDRGNCQQPAESSRITGVSLASEKAQPG